MLWLLSLFPLSSSKTILFIFFLVCLFLWNKNIIYQPIWDLLNAREHAKSHEQALMIPDKPGTCGRPNYLPPGLGHEFHESGAWSFCS